VDGLSFLSIDVEESNWLERGFDEQVWEVVRDLNGDRGHQGGWFHYGFFPKVLGVNEREHHGSF
jgi:hypothetical protein